MKVMAQGKMLPLKGERGIPEKLLGSLANQARRHGLEVVLPFSTEQIVVAQWVNLKCRYGCRQYNTNWCCPPATPGPDRVRAILGEFHQALLLVGTQDCPDFYLDNGRKRARQVRCWKGTVSLERALFLEGYYKAFGLVGETCGLCKECAYPGDCRFPQEKRPSVESFSIDLFGTLRNLGIRPRLAKGRKDLFNYYGLILVE
jgi:predicted metal-binding protein